MSHEVIQVIKLVKYNIKSYGIIRIKHNNGKRRKWHKNKHLHEMTRFQSWIIVWSLLHKLVRISGSSHGSIFESPVFQVHNEHQSESHVTGPDLTKRVWNAAIRNRTFKDTRTHIQYTRHMHSTHVHTVKHMYMHIRTHIPTYTYMQTHLNT